MRKENKLYIILSYIFFIFPPFIWGLVEIYSDGSNNNPQFTSLIVNIIVYALLIVILGFLTYKKIVHIPNKTESKHLVFGFIGNVTIYFYTFQNFMKIDDFITIYLILIVILAVYYLLFAREFKPLELWILAPTFLIIDTIHLLYTGCGYTDGYTCNLLRNPDVFTYILYSCVVLFSLGYYIVKIIKLRAYSILKYINIGLVILLSLVLQDIENIESKFIGTLLIAFPFFIIVDFIVSIVNKTFQNKTIIFYIRTSTILGVMVYLSSSEFFYGDANYHILGIMVTITYVSLITSILSRLLHVETSNDIIQKSKIKFISSKEHPVYIAIFSDLEAINDNQLLFVALSNNIPISYQVLSVLSNCDFKEAVLMPENDMLIAYLDKVESYLKSLSIYQLKINLTHKNDDLLNRKYTYLLNEDQNIYIKKL